MTRIVEIVPSFVLNAAWQIALVAAIAHLCARLLRDATARLRHALWVAALILSLALPLLSLAGSGAAAASRAHSAQLPNLDYELTPTTENQSLARAAMRAGADAHSSFNFNALIERRRQSVSSTPALAYGLTICFALLVVFRACVLWRAWRRAVSLRRGARVRASLVGVAAEARCRAAFGLRGVSLACSHEAVAPVTVGACPPLIILPESFLTGLSEEALLSVLGHEMAHVARHDFALNLAYELLLLPVSFHPLARSIKRQIDRTREVACDELVAARVVAPDLYARSLLRVAGALAPHAAQAFTLGVFDADILEERIMRLTRHTRRPGRRTARLLAVAAFTTLGLSCLAISSFSFNLRPGGSPALATLSASTHEPAAQEIRKEPPGRKEPSEREPDGSERFRGEIEPALKSDDAQTRARAACEAGHRHALDMIPALAAMLGDDSAIRPFECWDSGNWSPALDTFKQPSPGEQAAIAIASMGGDRRALEYLIKYMNEGTPIARRNAAWGIGELTNMHEGERAEAVPRLIELLTDGDTWVRVAAARALGEIRDERSVEALIAALGDQQTPVRWHAAWALGEMKEERAVEALCHVLVSDAKAEVRSGVAQALGEIQNRRAIPALRQALNDPEPGVRATVKRALAEIEDSNGE